MSSSLALATAKPLVSHANSRPAPTLYRTWPRRFPQPGAAAGRARGAARDRGLASGAPGFCIGNLPCTVASEGSRYGVVLYNFWDG